MSREHPSHAVIPHPTESLAFFTTDEGVRFKYDAATDTAYYALQDEAHPHAQLFGYTLLRNFASISKIERVGDVVYSVRPHASADIVPIKAGEEPAEILVSRFMCAAIVRDFDHYTGAVGHEGGVANIRVTDSGDAYLFDLGAVFDMFKQVNDVQLLLQGILDECPDIETVAAIERRLVRFLSCLKHASDPDDTEYGIGLVRHAIASTGVPVHAIFNRKSHDEASTHRALVARARHASVFVRNYLVAREAREKLFRPGT